MTSVRAAGVSPHAHDHEQQNHDHDSVARLIGERHCARSKVDHRRRAGGAEPIRHAPQAMPLPVRAWAVKLNAGARPAHERAVIRSGLHPASVPHLHARHQLERNATPPPRTTRARVSSLNSN